MHFNPLLRTSLWGLCIWLIFTMPAQSQPLVYVITGSVIKFGNIVSVTAKLIDTETAQIIDSADIKVDDINAVSNQIDKLALELAHE